MLKVIVEVLDEKEGTIRVIPVPNRPLLTMRMLRAALVAIEGQADEIDRVPELVVPNGPIQLPDFAKR
jgi:hypothetical protein